MIQNDTEIKEIMEEKTREIRDRSVRQTKRKEDRLLPKQMRRNCVSARGTRKLEGTNEGEKQRDSCDSDTQQGAENQDKDPEHNTAEEHKEEDTIVEGPRAAPVK